ncbi:hypothetical protein E1B28_000784 [Marasmius oreades]|uniref:Ornithine decarboxylase antizyme n=1 Tax=Marasmius oreades TaxID=181124 RepID=A0A9P7V259_9AGAR|nr:uncharacterized protein E1B28_000784 [Marasmius oreades]KAG7098884.1 hypothetical protein E1B28_000784 [Marasmius oreades]
MGLPLSTSSLVYLPCAKFKVTTTCTITLLRSLEDPGGAFDTPKVKCPPDRGSSECVTGRPAPFSPSFELSSPLTHVPLQKPIGYPTSAFSSPRVSRPFSIPHLVPSTTGDCSESVGVGSPDFGPQHKKDALEFLLTVFPRHGISALPHAKKVSISAQSLGSSFEGMILDLPGQRKTLYVDAKHAESISLRESIVALLDLADELLECSALVIVLERSSPMLGEFLHSFMYVGGTVVVKPPFPVDPAFVLVGMEI